MNNIEEIKTLNSYQQEAVLDESPACLVNANVGSGKTTVLIEKVRHLHEKKQVSYEKMAVLTFTNKAADEIAERLSRKEAELTEEELWGFGTFHSVALRILRRFLPEKAEDGTKLEEWNREFTVITPEDEMEMVLSIAKKGGYKIKYQNRLKKRMEEDYAAYRKGRTQGKYKDDLFQIFPLLEKAKRQQNKMSFEDLLEEGTQVAKEQEEVLDLKWIIVDEVQDSDEKQLKFLEALKGTQTHFFALGDPNQVIYSWRGSMFNIFYKFRELYHAEELSLPVNYRSSQTILAVSRRFQESGDSLTGVQEEGEKISVKNHYDPFQEAEYLADKIRSLHESGVPLTEIAVFYRLQSQSEILSKVLEKHQIPYEISQKKIIQDIPVLAWFRHILRFLSNHEDLTSGTYVLCDKTFGEGWTSKKARTEILNFTQGSVFLSKSLLFQAMWEYRDTGSGYINLWEQLSLEKYLRPSSSDYKENRRQILSLLKKMESYHSIRDFLNDLVLNGMEPEKDAVSGESVKLMTLHASKGLEFDHVFIIGVNDGLIPLNSRDASTEEEERRLFYVGMTRAGKFLELSFYINPGTVRVFPGPGRYLSSLPEKYLAHPADATRDTKEAARHLQDLKKMILEEKLRKLETPKQLVEHPKYGRGTIISENEDTIVIQFDDYGEKEMLKAFSQLKKIPNNN